MAPCSFLSPRSATSTRSIREFDPAVHQRQEAGRFWDAPDYCNNFIMTKA